ncbi:MAG: hypothetical protein IPH13_20490 [Planctomycetes bacterium]|nr:hypothetical protein [Planctomycetota bacterium]
MSVLTESRAARRQALTKALAGAQYVVKDGNRHLYLAWWKGERRLRVFAEDGMEVSRVGLGRKRVTLARAEEKAQLTILSGKYPDF